MGLIFLIIGLLLLIVAVGAVIYFTHENPRSHVSGLIVSVALFIFAVICISQAYFK